MKKGLIGMLLAMVIVTGTGCGGAAETKTGNDTGFKALAKDEQAKIKVMFYNEQAFSMLYGNTFSIKYPNIEIEVVPADSLMLPGKDAKQELAKLVDEQAPDVLFLNSEQYAQLAAEGKLLGLEPIIKKDQFDLDNIHPAVTKLLKEKGSGHLAGLASGFSANALYYNKDIFDRHGIPYPTDKMTWDDVFQLAKRFPTNGGGAGRVHGFFPGSLFGGYYDVLKQVGRTHGLSIVDADKMTVNINSEPWKHIMQSVVDLYKSGAAALPADPSAEMNGTESIFSQHLFIAGKAAMTVDGFHLISMMADAQKSGKDGKPVNWAVATEPVDRKNPDMGSSFSLNQVMAINAKSSSPAAAWELVKFLNSDEYAKMISKSSFELMTRTAYVKEKDGRSLEPFYKLNPSDRSYNEMAEFVHIPFSFVQEFNKIVNQEVQSVLNQKATIDEALKRIEENGREALSKAQLEQERQKEAGK